MMRALVIVLATGCLGRPQPHGHTNDGNSGDDGNATADADPCAWQGPVPIVIPVPAADALTGPWLDDTRSELWYAQIPNGTDPGAIAHAVLSAGTWSSTLLLDAAPIGYANPFFDEKRNSVWVDRVAMGETRHLFEYPLPGGPLIDHFEVTGIKAPSLTADGATLYTTAAISFVYEFPVTGDSIQTSRTLANPVSDSFQAPSVTSDGRALYVTRDGAPSNIYVATLSDTHDGYTDSHSAGAFQVPGKNYFDPNISRDGTTLVFASDFESVQPRIYYVTRPAGCAP